MCACPHARACLHVCVCVCWILSAHAYVCGLKGVCMCVEMCLFVGCFENCVCVCIFCKRVCVYHCMCLLESVWCVCVCVCAYFASGCVCITVCVYWKVCGVCGFLAVTMTFIVTLTHPCGKGHVQANLLDPTYQGDDHLPMYITSCWSCLYANPVFTHVTQMPLSLHIKP